MEQLMFLEFSGCDGDLQATENPHFNPHVTQDLTLISLDM